jgi:hypothetical protein
VVPVQVGDEDPSDVARLCAELGKGGSERSIGLRDRPPTIDQGDALGSDDGGRRLQRHPDERDRDAVDPRTNPEYRSVLAGW